MDIGKLKKKQKDDEIQEIRSRVAKKIVKMYEEKNDDICQVNQKPKIILDYCMHNFMESLKIY